MRRFAALLLLLAPAAGCASDGAAPGPATVAPALQVATPMRFRPMRALLDAGLAEARRGDARALRARSPDLANEGLALIKAVLPHDVARTDVPRYVEGRARFGEALKQWVTAVETGPDAEVIRALYRLDDATRGWIDAYLGREPETSV